MSRALEKDARDALQQEDPTEAFQAISSVLSRELDSLLEIELLPPSHDLPTGEYFLEDGNAIGIPKLRLVQAFTVAREKLKEGLRSQDDNLAASISALNVLLLMDPEHLTAANTRKRLLDEALLLDRTKSSILLLREKYFIDSLLTSRLHRHTKSPTLWSHRRWLIRRLLEADIPIDVAHDLKTVVFISGERHPRNYYAWCHARLLIDMAGNISPTQISELVHDTKRWCYSHHTDISGWSFLQFLLGRCQPRDCLVAFADALEKTENLQWSNESVWCFLSTLVAWEPMRPIGTQELRRVMSMLCQPGDDIGAMVRVFDEALRRIQMIAPNMDR